MLTLSVSAGRNMTRDNVLELRNSGFAVNDDNEPVPENIPVATTADAVAGTVIDRNSIAAKDWVFDGVDQWRTSGGGVFLPPNRRQHILHPFHVCPFWSFYFSYTHVFTSNSLSPPKRTITLPMEI